MPHQTKIDTFTSFVAETEPRLRRALTATFGPELGRDAAAEALVYAWRHWERVSVMDNPAGYLYRVGRDRGRALPAGSVGPMMEAIASAMPWVEPGLPKGLRELSEQQRTAFILIHGYEWTFGEVAEFMGVAKATVQTHESRAMSTLRKQLGVRNGD